MADPVQLVGGDAGPDLRLDLGQTSEAASQARRISTIVPVVAHRPRRPRCRQVGADARYGAAGSTAAGTSRITRPRDHARSGSPPRAGRDVAAANRRAAAPTRGPTRAGDIVRGPQRRRPGQAARPSARRAPQLARYSQLLRRAERLGHEALAATLTRTTPRSAASAGRRSTAVHRRGRQRTSSLVAHSLGGVTAPMAAEWPRRLASIVLVTRCPHPAARRRDARPECTWRATGAEQATPSPLAGAEAAVERVTPAADRWPSRRACLTLVVDIRRLHR